MISRREFLKVAGASVAFVGLANYRVGRLLGPDVWTQHLPIVTSHCSNSGLPAPEYPKIAMNYASRGFMRASPNETNDPVRKEKIKQTLKLLDYFKALGYTHIQYYLEFNMWEFSNASGHWVYNGGAYTDGSSAKSFRAMKEAVECRGMRLIPSKESLSHVVRFIEMDPSISEFHDASKPRQDQTAFAEWLKSKEFPQGDIDKLVGKYPLGRIAFVGENQGMDDLFREYLLIVKRNWGNTPLGGPAPEFYHIGHDELGQGHGGVYQGEKGHHAFCCIKAYKSKNLPGSTSQLVAAEINRRIESVHSILSPFTQVMIWGDSYLPADHGEDYQLIGDSQTGDGGVLQILRDRYQAAGSLIVMPWKYHLVDGSKEWGYEFSKVKQLSYLDRLGIRYIPTSGEHGTGNVTEDLSTLRVEKTKQTTFEWVRATQMFPRYLAGYAHLAFTEFDHNDQTGISHDFNACLLAYLVWTFEERSLKLARHNSYSPRIFSRVNYGLSSQEQKWTGGVHFARPPLNNSLPAVSSV